MKSFRPKDGSGDPPAPGRNGESDFHGQSRTNDSHESTTDLDARLYRKGPGRIFLIADGVSSDQLREEMKALRTALDSDLEYCELFKEPRTKTAALAALPCKLTGPQRACPTRACVQGDLLLVQPIAPARAAGGYKA